MAFKNNERCINREVASQALGKGPGSDEGVSGKLGEIWGIEDMLKPDTSGGAGRSGSFSRNLVSGWLGR